MTFGRKRHYQRKLRKVYPWLLNRKRGCTTHSAIYPFLRMNLYLMSVQPIAPQFSQQTLQSLHRELVTKPTSSTGQAKKMVPTCVHPIICLCLRGRHFPSSNVLEVSAFHRTQVQSKFWMRPLERTAVSGASFACIAHIHNDSLVTDT